MNKNLLISGLLVAIFSAVFAFVVINQRNQEYHQNYVGDLLFAKTYKQGLETALIIVKTPDMQATMVYDGKFWRVLEADNYYANMELINDLFTTINDSRVLSLPTLGEQGEGAFKLGNPRTDDKMTSGTLIETFTSDGKVIDSVIVGSKENNHRYARYSNNPTPFLVSGEYSLPNKLYSWLQQPLLQIDPPRVIAAALYNQEGEQSANRNLYNSIFYNTKGDEVNLVELLNSLSNLIFTDVKEVNSINLDLYTLKRSALITSESGLRHQVDVFEKEGKYWITTKISSDTLPTKAVSDYIKDSTFLYQGWFFEIPIDTGKILSDYTI